MVVTADVEEMKPSPSQEKPQEVGDEEVGRGSHFGADFFFLRSWGDADDFLFSWFGFASVCVLFEGLVEEMVLN